jgi:hypothetical protein
VLRRASAVLAVLCLTVLSGHVAPAIDDNNRYVKLTPLGDRVRLAYTVFFGEIPGAALRRTLDANHDGTIDEGEARAFGNRTAGEVARQIIFAVDGTPTAVTWSSVDVGLGTPDVDAGAFSVDLVTFACLASPRGKHRITLRDRFELEHPGETEVRVEDSPGVTVSRAHVGPETDPAFDFRFAGPGGPIASDGLELVFVAGPQAIVTNDGRCPAASSATIAAPQAPRVRVFAIVVAAVASALLVAVGLLRSRRRARAAS